MKGKQAHVCSLDMIVDESDDLIGLLFFLSIRRAEQIQLQRREREREFSVKRGTAGIIVFFLVFVGCLEWEHRH